ncbi:hypothetical protein Tco_1524249 [Tanacetum coccineum]
MNLVLCFRALVYELLVTCDLKDAATSKLQCSILRLILPTSHNDEEQNIACRKIEAEQKMLQEVSFRPIVMLEKEKRDPCFEPLGFIRDLANVIEFRSCNVENEMLKEIVNRDVGDAYMEVSEDKKEFDLHTMIKMKMLILNSLYQIILLSRMNIVYVIIQMRME